MDARGNPRKPTGLFATPQPVIVGSTNCLEVRLSRVQFLELFSLEHSSDRDIFITQLMRTFFNDRMGNFVATNTNVEEIITRMVTQSSYGSVSSSFYDGSGVDVIYIGLDRLDSDNEPYEVGRMRLCELNQLRKPAIAVAYVVLVEITKFSPMSLLYALGYGFSYNFSSRQSMLVKHCGRIYEDTGLIPSLCHQSLCEGAANSKITEVPAFCTEENEVDACASTYQRPLSLVFGNSRVGDHVLRKENGVCNCISPENIPTHLPPVVTGSARNAAICFSGACDEDSIKNYLGITDIDNECKKHCDLYSSWLENGGATDFYFPKTFGHGGQQRFKKLCSSFWKRAVPAPPNRKTLIAVLTLPLGLILCLSMHAAAFVNPVFALWAIACILLVFGVLAYLGLKGAISECERFGPGVVSVCRLPTWLGGTKVSNSLCGDSFDCECVSNEGCCRSCSPEPMCALVGNYEDNKAQQCLAIPSEQCEDSSCPGLPIDQCEGRPTCLVREGACTSMCKFGTPSVNYPLAKGPNCPNLNSSGTQNCSCSSKSGQCINETRTVLPPDETRIPRTTDASGVLVVASVTITIMWTSLCIAKLMRNRLRALDAGIIIASSLLLGIVMYFIYGVDPNSSKVVRENDLQLGICKAEDTQPFTTHCVLSSNQDEYLCASVREDLADSRSAGLCPECAVSFKCERDDDGSNPRCVFAGFGEGDYPNRSCDEKCTFNYSCSSDGSCVLSESAGSGSYATPDCESMCAFRYECGGFGSTACIQVEAGTGKFSNSSCTTPAPGVQVCGENCYTCNHRCVPRDSNSTAECEHALSCEDCDTTQCEWVAREGEDIKNCNDPTSPAACFQCTGVGLTTSSLTEGMQDALDALSEDFDVEANLCYLWKLAGNECTEAYACGDSLCSQCQNVPPPTGFSESDDFCAHSRNNDVGLFCGTRRTHDIISAAGYVIESRAQRCADIPLFNSGDSEQDRVCEDYMQCVEFGGQQYCTRCASPTVIGTDAMCTQSTKFCGKI